MRSAASFDTIVRRCPLGLSEGGADDAVVGQRRVEPVLEEAVLLDPVDLDLQACSVPSGTGSASDPPLRTRSSSMRAQRGPGGAADVVDPCLQPVELLDDVSGTTMSTPSKTLKQTGSAISTEVSSTTRARCRTAPPMSRSTAGSVRRSVCSRARRSDTGRRSVNATPCHWWESRRWIVGGRSCAAGSVAHGGQLAGGCREPGPGVQRHTGAAMADPCPFCSIVAGTTAAEVVLRDDTVVAFLDRSPLFAGHVLVVPRRSTS